MKQHTTSVAQDIFNLIQGPVRSLILLVQRRRPLLTIYPDKYPLHHITAQNSHHVNKTH